MGTILKEEDVKLEDWSGTVPPGAVLKIQDLVGRGVNTKIFAKEPIIVDRAWSAKGPAVDWRR